MEKELIIKCDRDFVNIALLEDKKLVELHKENLDSSFSVGDIFLGKIKMLRPDLNAAFLDVGVRKDAFLHYTDIGPKIKSVIKLTKHGINPPAPLIRLNNFNLEPDNPKDGVINQVFSKNQPILVQILKEPISTKGPRLTCEITLPGRYLVLAPFSNHISISKKIADPEERDRLKRLAESIRPKNFGMIVRTAAKDKKVADLHSDISRLMTKWDKMMVTLKGSTQPKRILSEMDKTTSLLRDLLNDSFHKIVIDDETIYNDVSTYVKGIAPDKAKIIKKYDSTKPIFDTFGVSKQIKASFGKTSTMSSGAYLVIESTEAMHVVDVNSGPKLKKNINQESAAKQVNLEAAKEIARQLRLRDIGGLIVIDFIDMRNNEHKKELYNQMKSFMSPDTAQHTILPLSKFGLMQITRQRLKPALTIDTSQDCPTCDGNGKIQPILLVIDEIDRALNLIHQSVSGKKLRLVSHPFIYSYLRRGFYKKQREWYKKFNRWITLEENTDFTIKNFTFYDKLNDEIRF